MEPGRSNKPKKRNKATTRTRILRATGKLLEQNGPPVCIKRVAEAARVSRAIVNHYFGTADSLLQAYRQSGNKLAERKYAALLASTGEDGSGASFGTSMLDLLDSLATDNNAINSLRLEFLTGQTEALELTVMSALHRSVKEGTGRFEDENALKALMCGAICFLLITANQPKPPWGISVYDIHCRDRLRRVIDDILRSLT